MERSSSSTAAQQRSLPIETLCLAQCTFPKQRAAGTTRREPCIWPALQREHACLRVCVSNTAAYNDGSIPGGERTHTHTQQSTQSLINSSLTGERSREPYRAPCRMPRSRPAPRTSGGGGGAPGRSPPGLAVLLSRLTGTADEFIRQQRTFSRLYSHSCSGSSSRGKMQRGEGKDNSWDRAPECEHSVDRAPRTGDFHTQGSIRPQAWMSQTQQRPLSANTFTNKLVCRNFPFSPVYAIIDEEPSPNFSNKMRSKVNSGLAPPWPNSHLFSSSPPPLCFVSI